MPLVNVRMTETGSTAAEVGVKQMTAVGMIHMGCFCGADLFYLGNTDDGQAPLEFIDSLKARLGPGHFGIFSSASGRYGECPFCGTLFELPDPELLDWLPFTDRHRFAAVLDEIAGRLEPKSGSPIHGFSSAPWNAM